MGFFKNLFTKKKEDKDWTVISIKKETPDAVTLSFDKPEGFSYKSGQYLILEKEIKGKKIRKEYSFSSSPKDNSLCVTIKKVREGGFSAFANDFINPNDKIKVMGPKGNFFVEPSGNKKYVAFAGGSGITPIMSVIKTLLSEEESSTIQLFYGNQSVESIIFDDELTQLEKKHPLRLKVTHVLENPSERSLQGIIDVEKLDLFSSQYFEIDTIDQFLICGPGKMIENINSYFLKKSVPQSKIKFELFTPAEDNEISKKNKVGIASSINYIFDDVNETITYADIHKSIIDAIEEADPTVPYSCKSGVCGSCTAKLVSGEVNYVPPKTNILSSENVAKGYILACCSYPNSEKIVIDFNDNLL